MRFAEQRKVDLTTVSIAKIFTLVMKKSLSRYGVLLECHAIIEIGRECP
jgi:hypothetical protein